MSIVDAFFGKTGKKGALANKQANDAYANQSFDRSAGHINSTTDRSIGRLDPWASGGQDAQRQYTNWLGLNGRQGYNEANAGYSLWDPTINSDLSRADSAISRRMAAMGQSSSGLNALARNRAAQETEFARRNAYGAQLQGLGAQGLAASGQQGAYDIGRGNTLASLEGARTGQLIGNQNAYTQMYNQADKAGLQNILGLAGTIGGTALSLGTKRLSGLGSSALAGITGGYNAGSMSGLGSALASRNYGDVGRSMVGPGGLPTLGGTNFFGMR
jgi:hypothetical protein